MPFVSTRKFVKIFENIFITLQIEISCKYDGGSAQIGAHTVRRIVL